MGVARLKSGGTVKSVVMRDRDGRELERYEAGIVRPATIVAPVPRPEPLPEPTLADMAEHLGGAMVAWAARGFPIAPRELRMQRLAICRACEHWREEARFGLGKCAHPSCGCTKAKLFIATERCPVRKW
jgi:hypothetical protein